MPENLAIRMRPKNIDQVIGQKHLVGEGKNYSSHGGSQSSVFYDSLRTARHR